MSFTDKQFFTVLALASVVGVYTIYKAREGLGAVNPLSPDNVFYGGVNSLGAELSGDEHFAFGGWLYDVTHDDIFEK